MNKLSYPRRITSDSKNKKIFIQPCIENSQSISKNTLRRLNIKWSLNMANEVYKFYFLSQRLLYCKRRSGQENIICIEIKMRGRIFMRIMIQNIIRIFGVKSCCKNLGFAWAIYTKRAVDICVLKLTGISQAFSPRWMSVYDETGKLTLLWSNWDIIVHSN